MVKNKLKLKNGSIEIKNKTETKAEIYFYGDIVSDEWMRWSESDQCPESVKKLLDDVKDVKDLDIYINSGGGSVFGGMAIYNMLKRNKANKTVYVDGLAGSISSVIAMAGDKVIIPKNAYLMIHKASSLVRGNSEDMRKMANTLDKIEEGILNVYADNLKDGVDIEEIKQLMEEETWFTGEEASKYFNIEVGEEVKAVACASDLTCYNKAPKELKEEPESITSKLIANIEIDYKKLAEELKNKFDETPENDSESFFELRKKLLNI